MAVIAFERFCRNRYVNLSAVFRCQFSLVKGGEKVADYIIYLGKTLRDSRVMFRGSLVTRRKPVNECRFADDRLDLKKLNK